jgi:hypothetical protein
VNDQETIDCFNPSGSAVRCQAHRATLSCGARLELAGQSDDFILRQRTMRLESVLKKTAKIGQVPDPGNSCLMSDVQAKVAAPNGTATFCVGKLM